MSCFPCFSSQKSKNSDSEELPVADATPPLPGNDKHKPSTDARNDENEINSKNIAAKTFNFRELAAATKNFRQECLLGEGGFGRVYKGTLQPSGQVVAVKQLDRNGMQGNKEFLVEVLMLSLLHHPNLVNLVGYCADGDQRLLVYEYMPLGSLDDRLLEIGDDKKPLDWLGRMKIASGAAQGLEYLHEKANPPVIYRDLKSSNILFDEELNPRLSDYGLAKLGLGGNKMHVMGTYGYCAPEYERKGELTLKSDVYSFGVVLLELITGRRAIDTARPTEEQNLVSWAQPYFRDPKRFPEMADPLLGSKFPVKGLNQVVGVAAMCLQEEPSVRPLISDVVAALSFLTVAQDDCGVPASVSTPSPPPEAKTSSEAGNQNNSHNHEEGNSSEEEDSDGSSDREDEGRHSSESSDDEDHRDEENSQKSSQGQTKKSVRWASRCKSKDGSDGLRSVQNSNAVEPHVKVSREDSNPNSSDYKVEPRPHDMTFGSSSSRDSNKNHLESQNSTSKSNVSSADSNSQPLSKAESKDGSSSDSSSSSDEDESDRESHDDGGRSYSKNSRSNSNTGSKYGSSSYSSRQDSINAESEHGSGAFNLRSNSNAGNKFWSVGSTQDSSNVGSEHANVALDFRSSSNVESHDGSIGSNFRRDSNTSGRSDSSGSYDLGSQRRSDSSS